MSAELAAAQREELLAAVQADATSGLNGAAPVPGPNVEPWPLLSPELPGFPLDTLPETVRRWASATAEATQTPADLAAWSALAVLAAAVMGAGTVDCGAWEEELGLYAVVAMPSGDRKSAVLRAATAPLRAVEAAWQADARPRVAEQLQRRDLLERRVKAQTDRAAKATGPDALAAEHEAVDARQALDALPEPVTPRLLADDATPEALGGLLAQHGRIAILAAESALLDNAAGRYSEGRGNLHLLCNAYTGEPTSIDRRGRAPEQLPRPLLTVALTIQPLFLARLTGDELAREQGLVARCVLVQPRSLLGARRTDAPAVPKQVEHSWATVVQRFADLQPDDTTDTTPTDAPTHADSVGSVSTSGGFTLRLAPGARTLLDAHRTAIEPRLAPSGDLRSIAAWVNRDAGRTARVAALLHLVEHSPAEPVGAETMRAALAIGEYALAHARAALTGPDSTGRDAVRWLTTNAQASVTVRDLHRGPLAGRGPSTDARALADRLAEHGYLRPAEAPPATSTGGRPPSPMYHVHPDLLTHGAGR